MNIYVERKEGRRGERKKGMEGEKRREREYENGEGLHEDGRFTREGILEGSRSREWLPLRVSEEGSLTSNCSEWGIFPQLSHVLVV